MTPVERRRTIALTEYASRRLPADQLTEETATALWHDYGSQVSVEWPSPKTEQQWALTAQGWVGYIPLGRRLGIALQPKVPLGTIFGMLEVAYRLSSFRFLDDLAGLQSLEAFYERLAHVLAKRVLDRVRRGAYRAYVAEDDRLPFVRGRIDVRDALARPWSARLHCHYEQHTADVEENQILAWTLDRVARSAICRDEVQATVRRAHRALRGLASLRPFRPNDCAGRLYNRLNADYHPMHALCRFFLEHTGPMHQIGERTALPFLVDMARLFELFVAEWLQDHLPPEQKLSAQERVSIGEDDALRFDIDLVISDSRTDETLCVLDTKYKAPDGPAQSDVSQVVTYAELTGCTDAVLIYPQPLPRPLDVRAGDIRVRSLVYALDGDLEAAGQAFLAELAAIEPVSRRDSPRPPTA